MDLIEQVAEEVRKRAPIAICDLRDNIQEAINAILEDNQGSDEPKPTIVSIPIGVKWNVDEGSVEITTSVSVKHRVKDLIKLEDPNQMPLTDRDGNPLPDSVAKPLQQLDRVLKESGAKANVKLRTAGGEA